MDEDGSQQFSLRWHNHQSSVIGALGHMLSSGALSDVTLSANGTSVKAHRLILASCSQYFAQLFKEVETDNNTLVVILCCEAAELRLLLTFMYTGEVTASKNVLPSLLRLAQTLKVSGLTDSDTNSTVTSNETEAVPEAGSVYTNLDTVKEEYKTEFITNNHIRNNNRSVSNSPVDNEAKKLEYIEDFTKMEKDRLSKLDQIVQNLYSTHKITNPISTALAPHLLPNMEDTVEPYDRKWRAAGSVCGVCNKRLSNQYNLRVHMETHAGRRHACRACAHVSRSRDALRKHVAYRHPTSKPPPRSHRATTTTSRLDG